jgi:copper homeostasis protein
MTRKLLLEISVESAEAAQAAERGGADRVELCADLSVGGLTPSRSLLREVRQKVLLPIFSMVRPRAGDFVYSPGVFEQMKRSIVDTKECRVDGVVLGILKKDQAVDVVRTRELVEAAKPLPVTFHRAFDECPDKLAALEDVIATGATRILTSGGAKSAPEGTSVLAKLIAAAGARITIIPGAGINATNISLMAKQTKALEFHSGLSTALPYGSHDYLGFEIEVCRLAEKLASRS